MEELQILVRRLLIMFVAMFALVLVLFFGLLTEKQAFESELIPISEMSQSQVWQPKNVLSELASMPPKVKRGYFLVSETPNNMGPMAIDSSMRLAGNNLACTNCHLKSGSQAGAASWVGVVNRFPQFGGRANKEGSLEDRINGCLQRSMNGKKLAVESNEMKAIVAYMTWLGEGLPEERTKEFKGYPRIKVPSMAVDLKKGKAVYEKECVLCHREDGQGIRFEDAAKGYQYPPLWGNDSYNNGAGMHRVLTAAQFIKSNMPFGQATWDNPKLTDEEAYHVAGYINSFERPIKNGTENDYPDKKLKPVSSPYGPWADDFSEEQHKYGPFPPIIKYYQKQYNITKTK